MSALNDNILHADPGQGEAPESQRSAQFETPMRQWEGPLALECDARVREFSAKRQQVRPF